jgi:hypothetical protein
MSDSVEIVKSAMFYLIPVHIYLVECISLLMNLKLYFILRNVFIIFEPF